MLTGKIEYTENDTTIPNPAVFSNEQESYQYMFDSEFKISYFLDSNQKIVNKLGHAVHRNHLFKQITFSTGIQLIAEQLGFIDPVVLQSMIIFKLPGSEELGSHRDDTFLYTEPSKTLGFWIALEDVYEDNSCLEFIPGSHLNNDNPVRWSRVGDKMKFVKHSKQFTDNKSLLDSKQFTRLTKATCPKGSLILIHGEVIHKSAGNSSDKSRYAYTFHIIETCNTVFPETNWLSGKGDKLFSNYNESS